MTKVDGAKPMKKRILILCTGNSARSQMAEGLLRHDAGDRFEVESAGTRPGHVRPEAIAVMKELGIDISGHRSKHVQEFEHQSFDYVLTVCDNAKETCPVFPGHSNRIHKGFEDPAAIQGTEEERLAFFRRVRDEIRKSALRLRAHRLRQRKRKLPRVSGSLKPHSQGL
jgi:arsenate reductase (thioredoxin)